jgi:hypothetical protein
MPVPSPTTNAVRACSISSAGSKPNMACVPRSANTEPSTLPLIENV